MNLYVFTSWVQGEALVEFYGMARPFSRRGSFAGDAHWRSGSWGLRCSVRAPVLAHSWGDRRCPFAWNAPERLARSQAGTFAAVPESEAGTLRQFAALQRGVRSWGKTARRRDPNKMARIDPKPDMRSAEQLRQLGHHHCDLSSYWPPMTRSGILNGFKSRAKETAIAQSGIV